MMRVALAALTTLMLFAFEGAARHALGLELDVAMAILVFVALERGVLEGAIAMLLVGYLADVTSGTGRGLHASSSVLVFLLVRLVAVRVGRPSFRVVTILAALAAVMNILFVSLMLMALGPKGPALGATFGRIIWLVVATSLAAYPVYRLFVWLLRRRSADADESLSLRPHA